MREILTCKNCKRTFWDNWNILCIDALDYCLKCANEKCNIQQLKRLPYGRN